MSAAHTPGPWAISAPAREYNNELMITAPRAGDNGVHVCEVTTNGKGNKKSVTQEQDANAALIAAAPELLAALISLKSTVKTKAEYDICAASVAKATGEQA